MRQNAWFQGLPNTTGEQTISFPGHSGAQMQTGASLSPHLGVGASAALPKHAMEPSIEIPKSLANSIRILLFIFVLLSVDLLSLCTFPAVASALSGNHDPYKKLPGKHWL
uniref:Uncharacterized protein n=1 Tax=Candidatus Kentrum sp. UNK TaxID=2126344 RepID=A0A451AWU5_9GAMM|nr:MAG: hypothetical protein BECKUNK1418G_GA0071005_102424 [Candidatus Kentron sp. UNK]VFK70520.1 MAG: hypothetical protein BECKUNK1418H_GA0071006_103024 [Candidatus Kentron sp. UNK]